MKTTDITERSAHGILNRLADAAPAETSSMLVEADAWVWPMLYGRCFPRGADRAVRLLTRAIAASMSSPSVAPRGADRQARGNGLMLAERASNGEQPIRLSATSSCAAMIDHVLACLTCPADNLIEPASAVAALELTLDIHQRLTRSAG